jgi:hypothetical protein
LSVFKYLNISCTYVRFFVVVVHKYYSGFYNA